MESPPQEPGYMFSPRSAPDLALVQRLEVRIRKAELEAIATHEAVQCDLQSIAFRPLPKLTRLPLQTATEATIANDPHKSLGAKGKSPSRPAYLSPRRRTFDCDAVHVPFQVKGSKFTAWNRSYMENRGDLVRQPHIMIEQHPRDASLPAPEERSHRALSEPQGYVAKQPTKLHLQQMNIPVRIPSPPQNSPARMLSSIDVNDKLTDKIIPGTKKPFNSRRYLRQEYEGNQRDALTMPKINTTPPLKSNPDTDKSLKLQGSSCSVMTFEPPRNTGFSRINPATHPEYFDHIYGEIFPKGTIENGLYEGFTLVGDYLPGNALRAHRQHPRSESRNQPSRMMPESPVPNVEYIPNHGLTGKKLVRIPNKNVTVKVASPRPNPWKEEEHSQSPPSATYVPPNSVAHHLNSFGTKAQSNEVLFDE